ncbi:NAD(P)-binding domain-containing protein, partial [Streptomyces sp. NPDC056257]|uniref:NAD(P)-binding domain-containing protein n=1 Tax=Streptomyces sp. NPDC056257 TaxID=3345765 RepID=UPI0035DD1FCB
MRTGIIGTGRIGSTLARILVAAGHQVVLANARGPQTLGPLLAELGRAASAALRVRRRGFASVPSAVSTAASAGAAAALRVRRGLASAASA